jgi:hypothetical protein
MLKIDLRNEAEEKIKAIARSSNLIVAELFAVALTNYLDTIELEERAKTDSIEVE